MYFSPYWAPCIITHILTFTVTRQLREIVFARGYYLSKMATTKYQRVAQTEDLSNVEFETSEDVEVIPTFDNMGLRDELLRGIYAYGKPEYYQLTSLLLLRVYYFLILYRSGYIIFSHSTSSSNQYTFTSFPLTNFQTCIYPILGNYTCCVSLNYKLSRKQIYIYQMLIFSCHRNN